MYHNKGKTKLKDHQFYDYHFLKYGPSSLTKNAIFVGAFIENAGYSSLFTGSFMCELTDVIMITIKLITSLSSHEGG